MARSPRRGACAWSTGVATAAAAWAGQSPARPVGGADPARGQKPAGRHPGGHADGDGLLVVAFRDGAGMRRARKLLGCSPPVASAQLRTYRGPWPSPVDPWCRGVWRSAWRSAAGSLTSHRGHGLASNHALRGRRVGSAGSDRQHTQAPQPNHRQVTRSLPMGERRHRLQCPCSHRGWVACCRAATTVRRARQQLAGGALTT
jgi:hypothetical protein